jgi:hypothetical protein
MEVRKTWEAIASKTETVKWNYTQKDGEIFNSYPFKFLCERVDQLEEKLKCAMDLVMHNTLSNQRHQHMRENLMMSTIEIKLNAIMDQLPNLDNAELKKTLTLNAEAFLEKSKELQDEDAKERNRLIECLSKSEG